MLPSDYASACEDIANTIGEHLVFSDFTSFAFLDKYFRSLPIRVPKVTIFNKNTLVEGQAFQMASYDAVPSAENLFKPPLLAAELKKDWDLAPRLYPRIAIIFLNSHFTSKFLS